MSLTDNVILNKSVFNSDLYKFIFVLFHEIAHQYQYRKYGIERMYALYNGKLPINDAVEWLRYTESVADQFAIRKCRELQKMGIPTGPLEDGSPNSFVLSKLADLKGAAKEAAENSKTQVAIPPLTITPAGFTLPSAGFGKTT